MLAFELRENHGKNDKSFSLNPLLRASIHLHSNSTTNPWQYLSVITTANRISTMQQSTLEPSNTNRRTTLNNRPAQLQHNHQLIVLVQVVCSPLLKLNTIRRHIATATPVRRTNNFKERQLVSNIWSNDCTYVVIISCDCNLCTCNSSHTNLDDHTPWSA